MAKQEAPAISYRIQLRNHVDFDYVIELSDYLIALGITHIYLSPIFKAPESSVHGYDIANPNMICSSLGGETAFLKMAGHLKQKGLKTIIDIVPNHMTTDPRYNLWWKDVLEKGNWSHFESFFDIYWAEFSEVPYRDKIILPILAAPLYEIIDQGELKLNCIHGEYFLTYFEHQLPINLKGVSKILEFFADIDDFKPFQGSLQRLRPGSFDRFFVSKESYNDYHNYLIKSISQLIKNKPKFAEKLQERLTSAEAKTKLLRDVLDEQYYKLIWWKNGRYLINYRRFFEISDLIAIRVERRDVFDETHRLIFDLYDKNLISGLRVDHPDGLSHPTRYFDWLRERCPNSLIFAEKILEADENLPEWPIEGSTGYDFMSDLTAIFIDPSQSEKFTTFYNQFTHSDSNYYKLSIENKIKFLKGDLESDFNRALRLFFDLVYTNQSTTDYSIKDCDLFLERLCANLEVYRTYLYIGQKPSFLDHAIEHWNQSLSLFIPDHTDLQTLADYFLEIIRNEYRSPAEQTFLDSLQKLTAPVMAKSIEDHVFYLYDRMVVLNEVGSSPLRFGIDGLSFHERHQRRLSSQPRPMLSTSTHDTKRSEDVRARLCVLSEIPSEWFNLVKNLHQHKENFDSKNRVDTNTEYFMYQNLIGAWPISMERFQAFMLKSVREAKTNTSWREPKLEFEESLAGLIEGLFTSSEFHKLIENFISELSPGDIINSLSQVLVKLTIPGIADIYQGCETFDYSLVDPDNRRPIDHTLLQNMLSKLPHIGQQSLQQKLRDPMIKLWLSHRILNLRKKYSKKFDIQHSYRPIFAESPYQEALLAFMRGEDIVVLAPRFFHKFEKAWKEIRVPMPSDDSWHDYLNDKTHQSSSVALSELWINFPGSLLIRNSN